MERIKLLRKLNEKNSGGLELSKKMTNPIAIIYNEKNKKNYINLGSGEDKSFCIDDFDYGIFPHLPKDILRFLVKIYGTSGIGKGIIVNELISQYHQMFPNNKIFYVCGTDVKKDISYKLNMKHIIQLDIERMTRQIIMEKNENNLYVFDDIDNNENHQVLIKIIGKIVECGRKFNCSLFFLTHEETHKKYNCGIDEELDIFISYKDFFLSEDNYLFKKYFKIKLNNYIKDTVKESKSNMISYNLKKKYIITDHCVVNIDETGK